MHKKIVIYTAIFGGKDNLVEPKFVPNNCDFICFTDSNFDSKIWKVRKTDLPVAQDFVRSARKYKILPHKYLGEYEYSIWVDGNILVRGDVADLIRKYLKGVNMAVYDHANYKSDPGHSKIESFLNIFKRKYKFVRHSVQEEADKLIKAHDEGIYKDDPEIIKRQMQRYKQEGFPDDNSVVQSSVIVRRYNAKDVVKAMEVWWNEVKNNSRRDQLSFNYAAWKTGLKFVYMKGDPRKNKYVIKTPHKIKKDYNY